MRLSMDLEMQDKPGQLLMALEPLREQKGNIISVLHHRDKKTPRGTIPVRVILEMDRSRLEAVKEQLQANGIIVVRAGEDRFLEEITVLLVGHVLDRDLGDTVHQIDSTGFAEVVDLSLSMPGIDEPSSAYLRIRATGKDEIQKAMSILRQVGVQKDLLVIEPIEADEP